MVHHTVCIWQSAGWHSHGGRQCGSNAQLMKTVQEPRNSAAGLDGSPSHSSPSFEGWISGLLDPCILVKTAIVYFLWKMNVEGVL